MVYLQDETHVPATLTAFPGADNLLSTHRPTEKGLPCGPLDSRYDT